MANPLKNAKRIALGASIAGAAGYVAGILSAPNSGKETRDELRKAAGKNVSEVEAQLHNLQAELGDLVNEAKGKGDDLGSKAQKELRKVVDNARDAKDKAAAVLTAVQSGKASDKDLTKAIVDAKHTIEHIRDYLKK